MNHHFMMSHRGRRVESGHLQMMNHHLGKYLPPTLLPAPRSAVSPSRSTPLPNLLPDNYLLFTFHVEQRKDEEALRSPQRGRRTYVHFFPGHSENASYAGAGLIRLVETEGRRSWHCGRSSELCCRCSVSWGFLAISDTEESTDTI